MNLIKMTAAALVLALCSSIMSLMSANSQTVKVTPSKHSAVQKRVLTAYERSLQKKHVDIENKKDDQDQEFYQLLDSLREGTQVIKSLQKPVENNKPYIKSLKKSVVSQTGDDKKIYSESDVREDKEEALEKSDREYKVVKDSLTLEQSDNKSVQLKDFEKWVIETKEGREFLNNFIDNLSAQEDSCIQSYRKTPWYRKLNPFRKNK